MKKSLHLCNLANAAYGYCKILRQAGYPLDLRCHDLRHLMSQPEWDDLALDSADFPEENNFFNNTADLQGYRRPEWFLADDLVAAYHPAVRMARRVLPRRVRRRIAPYYYSLLRVRDRLRGAAAGGRSEAEACSLLAGESGRYGGQWAVRERFFRSYLPHARWVGRHARDHEVIFAYALSPIYAMVYGRLPYVSVEIGTMRDVPFDGSETGKLLALAYRRSSHVLLTNPDNKRAAERLGVTDYSFCPHPLDEDVYTPGSGHSPLRAELCRTHDADLIFFAPARQNWAVKGNDKYLRAFAALLRRGLRAALIVPGWGQEVSRSKRLCAELGIESRVIWQRPLSEKWLIRYYQACDLVLDQFHLGVFGLITPKAMSCGKPVLTSYDPDVHTWCFAEHPPLVRCRSEKEIADSMLALGRSARAREEVGRQSRRWVLRHHSRSRILEVLSAAMDRAAGDAETETC